MSNDNGSKIFKKASDSLPYAEGAASELGKKVKDLRKYELRTDRKKKKNQEKDQS
jgi:hypothetical protein